MRYRRRLLSACGGHVSALSVSFPRWTDVADGTTRVDGPVTQYVAGESFGVFALDEDNKVMLVNVPMTAASSAVNTAIVPTSQIPLPTSYTYYVYYPYDANMALTYGGSAVTKGRVLDTKPTATNFFAAYILAWNISSSQSTLAAFQAQDLQTGFGTIARGSTRISMTHRMSLAKFVLQSASVVDTRTYNGNTGANSDSSTVTVTPNSFSSTSPNITPYNSSGNNYYCIAKYNQTTQQVADGGSTEYSKWSTPTILIQKSDGTALSAGRFREWTITSRAAARGWKSYKANYSYIGSAKAFTPPVAGTYKFECWGAQGGGSADYCKGGYTSGNLAMQTTTTLYVYVGGYGGYTNASGATEADTRAWNGGGGGLNNATGNKGGGGATDIRTASGAWNSNLNKRIMVAAGGGGVSHGGFGGYGGGLTGRKGVTYQEAHDEDGYQYNAASYKGGDCSGGGATQSAGGAVGTHDWNTSAPTAGGLGYGGDGNGQYGGGGGGGYYGGGGSGARAGSMGGGGGGSSYISGHSGCSTFTGYVFSSTVMKSGGETQTNQNGVSGKGHSGEGYARITFVTQ